MDENQFVVYLGRYHNKEAYNDSGLWLSPPHRPLFLLSDIMGVKGLLQELIGRDVKVGTRVGFSTLEILLSCPADINTGTLTFVCALRHKGTTTQGLPTRPRDFQHQTTTLIHHTYCLADGYYHVNTRGSSNISQHSCAENLPTHRRPEVGAHPVSAPA